MIQPTLAPLLYTQSLAQAGLTPEQAVVYEILLKNGSLPARKIARQTPYKRTLVYKLLADLQNLGLVVRHDAPAKVSVFEPQHPLKLRELAQKKEQQALDAQTALEGILSQLSSEFNLSVGRPGVQFFEGREGIKKALEDTLTSKTEIYAYSDIEAILKFIPDINKEYVAKRERLKIKKRGIFIDTPAARKELQNYHPAITQNKFIKYDAQPFEVILQIYNNKISYITLRPDKMMAVIISDPYIYNMHKYFYEFLWQMI